MKSLFPQQANRRHVLFGAAGISGAALASPLLAKVPAGHGERALDLSDPQVALDTYVKLRGSTADETVFQYYEGDIFALIGGQSPVPLTGFRGIQKSIWRRDGMGGYTNQDYDVGFYVDYETREILEEWDNPVTGKRVKVYHYRGGPSGGHFRKGEHGDDVYGGLNGIWSVAGNQISQRASYTGARPNPLSLEEWPLASSGPELFGAMTTAFVGRVSDVADPAICMAPSTQIWTNTTSWMPWMEFGQLPGFNEWRWIGSKGVDPADFDQGLVAAAENVWPGYVSRDSVWQVPVSGRNDYINLKRGLPLSQ